jgi:dolichol-phosphate mannosyltransferase
MIPTYNEADNIAALLRELFALGLPGFEAVVVDDQSPDGTAEIVRGLQASRPGLHLLVRRGARGRGLAGRDGFLFALERGFDSVIEMDGDFSHQPRFVPALVAALADCDLVIGSRMIAGGTDDDRPLARRVLTVLANLYARLLLGLPVSDTNSGFRCFSRRALEAVDPASLSSRGPSIVHEALYRVARARLRVREVPIEFIDRKRGVSKLTLARLAVGYLWIARLRLFGR